MFLPYDLLALVAAACWAIGSILAVAPARHLGPFAFNRWRLLIVATALWLFCLVDGGWRTLSPGLMSAMALSGLIGIFIGDTALFAAMNRLGPRRTGVLFASHALFTPLLSFVWLGETMNSQAMFGALLTVAGVMAAVLLGRRAEENHEWEMDQGDVRVGIALGLIAALCQALGTLLAKPVMTPDVDPVAASAVRITAAGAMHFLLLFGGVRVAMAHHPLTFQVFRQTATNGLLAMGVGMTLVLLALKYGNVGMVAVLSSVSPVLVLPLLWWRLGRSPAPGAWFGAALTVLGTALILLR
ncbi:DMT family transporter [Chitinimonas sp. PSY-7]|uniref:EamA family transporter n=1 Tax=Chitinimonas sp. PSY-7 TaxID=3459088 RepID=UPI00403FFEE4